MHILHFLTGEPTPTQAHIGELFEYWSQRYRTHILGRIQRLYVDAHDQEWAIIRPKSTRDDQLPERYPRHPIHVKTKSLFDLKPHN